MNASEARQKVAENAEKHREEAINRLILAVHAWIADAVDKREREVVVAHDDFDDSEVFDAVSKFFTNLGYATSPRTVYRGEPSWSRFERPKHKCVSAIRITW